MSEGDWYQCDDTFIRDVAIALAGAKTEFAHARVYRDGIVANIHDDDLQKFADGLGQSVDELRVERAEARARLAAAAHELHEVPRIVAGDAEGSGVMRRIVCADCRRSLSGPKRSTLACPMLRGETWRKLANGPEELCFECMLDRARERDVAISIGDLIPSAFCLFHWPRSHFNVVNKGSEYWPWRHDWRYAAWTVRDLPGLERVWFEL